MAEGLRWDPRDMIKFVEKKFFNSASLEELKEEIRTFKTIVDKVNEQIKSKLIELNPSLGPVIIFQEDW